MNPEIKDRIAKIKAGQVPEGYKITKGGIIPEEWKSYKAKYVFQGVTNKKHNGKFEVLSVTQGRGIIPRSQVDIDIKYNSKSITGYKQVDVGDFVISLRSFQGGIEYSECQGIVSPAYTVLKPIKEVANVFYKNYFKSDDYIKRLNIAIYGIRDGKQIGYEDFGNILLHYPSIKEQNKIAEILTTWENGIELKQKLITEKKAQKKWLMQHFFTGKKRLLRFSGEWKLLKAKYIFQNYTNKNHKGELVVLSATQDKGVIPRADVNIKIRFNTDNLTSYKKVNKGDFVISLRSFQGGIEISHYDGIVSPAYIVFSEKIDICKDFYKHFFKTEDFITRLNVAVYGIRDGKQISFLDFSELYIPYPSPAEQTAIAEILSIADREIELLEKELAELERQKKGLMQLLLTGIVRVNS